MPTLFSPRIATRTRCTMSKHTPGPWRAAGTDIVKDYRGEFFKIISKPCGDYDVDEEMANALLIAAAPEMLSALIRLKLESKDAATVSFIQSVIAKATGQK